MKLSTPRAAWKWLFIAINITAACIMFANGELIGDMKGPIYDNQVLLVATILVVLSYWIILDNVFNLMYKVRVNTVTYKCSEDVLASRMGKFLFLIQILFLIFNYVYGINIAGNTNNVSTPLSLIWVFIPPDPLFMIYYGVYRENKMFYPNLFIWVISNFLRGWSGIFLIIIFFEWCRSIRKKKINIKLLLICLVVLIALYPILLNLKFMIRFAGSSSLSISALLSNMFNDMDKYGYMFFLNSGITQLVGRIQIVSPLIEVIHMRDRLQIDFSNGKFAPFWMEGLHGIIFDRLFSSNKSVLLGTAFTEYVYTGQILNAGSWNTNLSYPAWFFIAPYLSIAYIMYTLFLCFISCYLVKKISDIELAKDMLWISWALYIFAPWWTMVIGLIYALLVFYLLKLFFGKSKIFNKIKIN